MLLEICFENLHIVMAILVLFELFSRKFCLNFLILILRASPKVMHFVRTFSIMRASGVKLIAIEEVRNHGKLYAIKIFLKMAVGRMHSAHISSYPFACTPGHKLQKPPKGSGKFQSLGTISFVLFYEKEESKGGHGTMDPF